MPNWGLTQGQRELQPWDLHAAVLAPCKVTTDEVWGDIHTTVIEQALVDTQPMQRLRRVRQLGMSHLVYPGATHTRFSHSLGALKVVQDLLDATLSQAEGLHPAPDWIGQWNSEQAPKKIAEAIVLGRLGALLHDLCHVPYGHSIEDDLNVLVEHDANGERFTRLWRDVAEQLPARLDHYLVWMDEAERARAIGTAMALFDPDARLRRQLRPLIISKDDEAERIRQSPADTEYPFVEDLVGDTICADLLDYLLRDHQNTGLPASLGKRFVSAFFAVPEGRGVYERRAALSIVRRRHERTDVISELLKALRYRYELNERVLYHHAKLSADAMIGRTLDLWSDAVWLAAADNDLERIENPEDLLERRDVRTLREQLLDADEQAAGKLDEAVRERLEDEFLSHGDDGLLERIAALDGSGATGLAAEMIGVREHQAADLAKRLLRRELFKVAGRVGKSGAPSDVIHSRYGDNDARQRILEDAQRFAELGQESKVLMWLPNPKMRLKLAGVLVDDGHHINPFSRYEDVRGRRGSEIYRAEEQLWAMWVFVDPALECEDRDAVLIYLAKTMGVAWEQMVDHYGPYCWEWMPRWGLSTVMSTDDNRVDPHDARVGKLLERAGEVSRRERHRTKTAYFQSLRALEGMPPGPTT